MAKKQKLAAVKDLPPVPAKRKMEDIHKEYMEICGQAGDKQYRKEILTSELVQINTRLLQLNQEAAAVQSEQAAAASKQEAAPKAN